VLAVLSVSTHKIAGAEVVTGVDRRAASERREHSRSAMVRVLLDRLGSKARVSVDLEQPPAVDESQQR
jgi:hypothetical protein